MQIDWQKYWESFLKSEYFVHSLLMAVGVLLLMVLALKWKEYRKKKQARKRFKRGLRLENEARKFLQSKGYDILEEQGEYEHHYTVNGETQVARIVPDYIVQKNGKTYIVEVKSGVSAIHLKNKNSRRQLLEYDFVIENDGVILLDMENKFLQHVVFESRETRQSRTAWLVVIALLLLAVFIPNMLIKIGAACIALLVVAFKR